MKDQHDQAKNENAYEQEIYVLDSGVVVTERALVQQVKYLQKCNIEKDNKIAMLEKRLR